MAKAWIDDAWLRDSVDKNGNRIPPTAAMRRAAGADPEKAKRTIPPEHRTARYGKGSRWVVYWAAPDGRHRKSFRNRADAEAFKAGMEDDIRAGKYIDPRDSERTLANAYRAWIESRADVKGSTLAGYERVYASSIGPKWGDTPVGLIDADMIGRWIRELLDGTAPGTHKGPVKASTAAQHLIVLGAILQYAVDRRWIPANPARGIRIRQTPSTRVRYLTPEQIEAIADAAEHRVTRSGRLMGLRQDATMIRTLAYTGIRDGELLALRVGDVHYRTRRIHITKTVTWTRDGKLTEGTPKNGRNRKVPIPRGLIPALHEQTDGRDSDDYLFVDRKGHRILLRVWLSVVWHPSVRAAGIPDMPGRRVTPHVLRHSYASMAIAAGCDPKTLQQVLGHSSAKVTLDTYAEMWPDRMDVVADAIADRYMTSPKPCPQNVPKAVAGKKNEA